MSTLIDLIPFAFVGGGAATITAAGARLRRRRSDSSAAPAPEIHRFRVEINGEVVWSGERTGGYIEIGGSKNFPPEYLSRPVGRGATPVYLYVDGVLVGRQLSLEDEEYEAKTGKAVDGAWR